MICKTSLTLPGMIWKTSLTLTYLLGMIWKTSPTLTKPASILPMTIVPISFHRSTIGRRMGARGLRSTESISSRVCREAGD